LRYEEAGAAIRKIGTNAVPYLVEWMAYQRPYWKRELYGRVAKLLPSSIASSLTKDRRKELANACVTAFPVLGADANAFIPPLVQLMNAPSKRDSSAFAAALGLMWLGPNGQVALVAGMTNRHTVVRDFVAHYFEGGGDFHHRTLPALMELLHYPDPMVRTRATNAVRRIDPTALEGTNGR
jgi:hypothetical protein